MHVKTISGTVTTPVVLGTGNYGSHLTIATTGAILPTQSGADAILAPADIDMAHVTNQGQIIGGAASSDIRGGAGIDLQAAGSITNLGSIVGGVASYFQNAGLYAGDGIVFGQAGRLDNTGTIAGGAGGASGNAYGYGGNGVACMAGGTIINQGLIAGGANGGSYGYLTANGIACGQASNITNTGTIQGGDGAFHTYGVVGGFGIYLHGGGILVNHGLIRGGNGGNGGYAGGPGADAIAMGAQAAITNTGTIEGGHGGSSDEVGAFGGSGLVFLAGGTFSNTGLVLGGAGGYADGNGGYGLSFGAAGSVINSGTIEAQGARGVGIGFRANGALTNTGTIAGGPGANGYYGGTPGGAGVSLAAGGTIGNHGTITGGAGGDGAYAAGAGGAGIVLGGAGSTLVNTGVITGGAGGSEYGNARGAAGGAGVYINGGTLTNSGTIAGGAAGSHAAAGDAVQFGSTAATLVVDPGAVFIGKVVADGPAKDTLELNNRGGTLTGLGTAFTGFAAVDVESHARWTVAGPSHFAGTLTLGADATLTIGATASLGTVAFAGPGLVQLVNPPTVTAVFDQFGTGDVIALQGLAAASFSYAAGTLTLYDAGGDIVDRLDFAGTYTDADFTLQSNGHGGTDVLYAGDNTSMPRLIAADFLTQPIVADGGTVVPEAGSVDSYAAALFSGWPTMENWHDYLMSK